MRALITAVLRVMLRCYPVSFRARFGDDLEEALEDRLDDIGRHPLPLRVFLVTRLGIDLAVAGLRERLSPSFGAEPPGRTSSTPGSRGSLVYWMSKDIRFAVRSLLRRPGFTALVLFTLALGTGSSTAVFTVVDGVLLRPLPFPEPDELLVAWTYNTEAGPVGPDGQPRRGWMSQPDIESLREMPQIDAIEGIQLNGTTLTGVDRPDRVSVSRSTGGLLTLLDVAPLMGRDLRNDDNDPDAPRVLVVSHGFWMDRLGGDPDVIGSSIELAELTWEIVGVAPADFDYPAGTAVWQPLRLDPVNGCERACHVYEAAMVRLSDGTTFEAAQAAVDALASSLSVEFPGSNTDKGMRLEPLIDYEVGDVRDGLWVVFGAVGLVLLIVCANTANLLLVRASSRGREVTVRTALGASRGRLFAQVITESLVLAVLGSALGLAVSLGLLEGLRALAVDHLPRMADVRFHAGILLYLAGITASVALLFGVTPALHASRRRGANQLLGGSRGGSRSDGRVRSVLLAVEVAFSILLLAGSGLLVRSLGELYRVDMGFDGSDVTRFSINLPDTRYDDIASLVRFYGRLEDGIAAIPGVEAVGSVYGAPLMDGNISGIVFVEGRPRPQPADETGASIRSTTPGYFDAMGITLARGRGIERTDVTDSEPVAVVNEQFVRENFPDQEVLGRRVRITADFGFGSPWWRVVGVARDVRRTMGGQPTAEVYVPHAQFGPEFMQVHVRTRAGLAPPTVAMREVVATLDPNLAVLGMETIPEAKRRDTADMRFFILLVTSFAAVAVVLAGVGLYGVVAFLVAQRRREIGIRMALGARTASVTGMVLRQGLWPTLIGVLAGLMLTVYGGSVMEGLLFEVRPGDPVVLLAVSVLVLLVATAATLMPARRASRVDPTEALRAE